MTGGQGDPQQCLFDLPDLIFKRRDSGVGVQAPAQLAPGAPSTACSSRNKGAQRGLAGVERGVGVLRILF